METIAEAIAGSQKMMEQADTPRAKVLGLAASAILQDRNKQYGPPENNFQDIVDLWNTRIKIRLRELGFALAAEGNILNIDEINILKSQDVAVWMMDVKTARLETSPTNIDNWADTAGYAGCGYECAIAGEEKNIVTKVEQDLGEIEARIMKQDTTGIMYAIDKSKFQIDSIMKDTIVCKGCKCRMHFKDAVRHRCNAWEELK